METKTELLDAVELELGAAAMVTDLHAALQARLGWEAPERLERCAAPPEQPPPFMGARVLGY